MSRVFPAVNWRTSLGLSLLAAYGGWNVYWLAIGRIPPSMLTGLTGVPCPTTGGTRSIVALLHGDVVQSLYFNPMTIPIVGLLTVTVGQVLRRGHGAEWLVHAWISLLGAAWLIKLASPPATW